MNPTTHVHPLDVFGLRPIGPALTPVARAVLGGGHEPPNL
jgi:hypothetical protein